MYTVQLCTLAVIAVLIKIAESHIIIYRTSTHQLIEEFYDLPASFGPNLPSIGTKFLAVTGYPKEGCSPMRVPPKPDDPNVVDINKYVVVIQRKNCTFEEKVRNAQNAGYSAVIVYNYESDDLEQMSAKNAQDIKIPSVFVGASTGMYITEGYDYTSGFSIVINDELPFNINTHLILPFSILIGLCFIIMIFYMIYKCVREQRRLRQHRLPKRLLKKIPTTKFTKGQPYETCVICLDEFVEGEKLRVLPCSHAYHSSCIDPWLTKNRRVCPICKRKVFARGEARRPNRRRQASSDSDTDDDTAPLLNPVVNGNNHGTFGNNRNSTNADLENPTSDEENVLLTNQSGNRASPRINPFDRTPNLPPNLASELSGEQSIWSNRFLRIFRRRPTIPGVLPSINEGLSISASSHTLAVDLPPQPASNNVLNSNLSGSFKDDDEMEAHQSIYEPIATTMPSPSTVAPAPAATATASSSSVAISINLPDTDSAFIQTPSQGGIGVVALPNTNLDESNLPNRSRSSGSGRRQYFI